MTPDYIKRLQLHEGKVETNSEPLNRKLSRRLNKRCVDCGKNWADYPSKLCPGCEAYREHTGAL